MAFLRSRPISSSELKLFAPLSPYVDAVHHHRPTIVAILSLIWLNNCLVVTRAEEPPPAQWIVPDQPAIAQRLPPVANVTATNQVASVETIVDPAVNHNESAKPTDSDDRPRLNVFWDNGAVLESADRAFRFHIGGRLEFDNTWYHQSQDLPFLLEDGVDMRRARLRADGTIGENVDFATEVNIVNIQDVTNEDTTAQIGSVGLTDFYVDFKQVPLLQNVRIGHFHEPLGLENTTSSNYWYYMEQSPGHDAFLQPFDYVTGIESFNTWCDDRISGAIAFERVGKLDVSPFSFGTGPGNYAATGRVTCLPFYQDEGRRLLHLGIGYSYSGTGNNFSSANRPLVRAGATAQDVPNVIFTGMFFTPNAVQIAGAEIATVIGRFALSAEYQLASGSDLFGQFNNGVFSDPRGDVTYQAMYVEGGFFLNPEDYRRYDKKSGTWGRQLAGCSGTESEPRAGWRFSDHTPVQLICRYSYLNLASGNPVLTPSSGAQAGWENDITAGVDWYINPEVHFIVNYVYTHLSYVDGSGGDINGLGCRLHLDF